MDLNTSLDLAVTEEVWVIIFKLADRLHNMRTLSHMPSHKQASIAMETPQVFAPIPKLLGMCQIKYVHENLFFMYTNRQDYAKVKRRIAELSKEQDKEIEELRIIVRPKPCVGVGPLCNAQQICYHVLGLIHGIWTPIPRAMKDYIETPKPNGYQSLHTAVIPFLFVNLMNLNDNTRLRFSGSATCSSEF
ncbi:Beta-grasp domain-containing protein [Artemisia annua]|uniref:Beta-grasp domain-containing protein n=1 Tax=Artemisia annua TaxID=35608 RepID=A0A2U1NCT2_ARTAN|nr:Beta-grasp domain-containing protein [Artemisia annua]